MTTRDNQTTTISVKISTQTRSGMNWEGTVEITGPVDEEMLDELEALSKELEDMGLEASSTDQSIGAGQLIQEFNKVVRSYTENDGGSIQILGAPSTTERNHDRPSWSYDQEV